MPRRVLSSRSLLAEPVAESARKRLSPSPISRFCHRDPTRDFVSPGAVSRFGFALHRPRPEPEVLRARRRRSISATTMRYVGTPLRVLRFLARGSGANQFTLAATVNGCPSEPCSCERCRRLRDFGFPISAALYCLRMNEDVAPADRLRVEDFALLPGDRAPTQRRSSTPWSPFRAHVALETPTAFRTDRGSVDAACPAKGMCRATPRPGVALPTTVCEENRSAFHREGFPRERVNRSTRLERPASLQTPPKGSVLRSADAFATPLAPFGTVPCRP
jgi:hypothetical protein